MFVAGSKWVTLKPPSSVIQKVPSLSATNELGAASAGIGQRVTVLPSGESRAMTFSLAEAVQTDPSGLTTMLAAS